MTYTEKSTQLALDSSVAVLVTNAQVDDLEFLPLKPRQMSETDRAELAARWPGRGLRSMGVIGLVGTSPRYALKEPLEPEQVSTLAGAFLAYLHVLFSDSFKQEGAATSEPGHNDFVQFAERLYALEDSRRG